MRMRAWLMLGAWALVSPASAGQRVEMEKGHDIVAFKSNARLVVRNVTLDFWPPGGRVLGDPRKKGRQFVRVEIAVTNTGTEPYSLNYTSFDLSTSEAPRVTQTSSINKGNSTDRLGTAQLPPGGSALGRSTTRWAPRRPWTRWRS